MGRINIPAGLEPHEQRSPEGTLFSSAERSQVQAPAARAPGGLSVVVLEDVFKRKEYIRQEHLAPSTLFSLSDLAHVHSRAFFSPQEHFA